MKVELTDKFLRNQRPPEAGRIEFSDTKRPGLRFRLSATGRATWAYEKRVKGGPKRKTTLGTWPAVSLAEARKIALEIEAEASQGVDRVAEARAKQIEDEIAMAKAVSCREVLDHYNALHLSTLRTGRERLRQIEQSLGSKLDLPFSELETRHLQAAVDAKIKQQRLVLANRIRAALQAFTAWSVQRGYITTDIGASLAKAAKEKSRERAPSVEEIRQIYEACEDMGPIWAPLFRLLILTGQRRTEITKLRFEEIDLASSRLVKSGEATKNKRSHITHLSEPAISELISLGADENRSGFVFTTTGRTEVSGFSKAKKRLDALLGPDFEPWRLHDLRRSLATALAETGEPEAVVDRILNHSASGSAPSAVARVYQRSDLLPQRARALDKWAAIVTDATPSVVSLRANQN